MDCAELYRARKAVFGVAITSIAEVAVSILSISTAWFHVATPVAVTYNGADGNVVTEKGEVDRTAGLIDNEECRPALYLSPALCVSSTLADQLPGEDIDSGLYTAGAASFTFVFFGLLVSFLCAVLSCAALLKRTATLHWRLQGHRQLLAAHALYCLFSLLGFAIYAGVVNGITLEANQTTRFGFGFGMTIIGWIISTAAVVMVFKLVQPEDVPSGTKPAPSPKEAATAAAAAAAAAIDPAGGAGAGAGGAGVGGAGKLPRPWESAKDPETGQTYYWNPMTNETSWDVPADSVAAGVAKAAAAH